MATNFTDDHLARGKALVEDLSGKQYELGELADEIEKSYGDDTLGEYAEAIGITYDTLKGYRYVWRRWKDSPVKPHNFSVAKALASYKDRNWYIQEWPNDTEEEARDWVREEKKKAREKREAETLDAEKKGATKKLEVLKRAVLRAAGDFFSDESKEADALGKMAKYYSGRLSWTEYSDIWDALEAARTRAREAMNKLDLILKPEPEAGEREQEPESETETTEPTQMMFPIPFRKGESDDDV
jgi:hypothetical protein